MFRCKYCNDCYKCSVLTETCLKSKIFSSIVFTWKIDYLCMMFKNREYIRPVLLDAVVILSILFIGLMINSNTLKNEPVHKNNPVSAFISVSDKSAVSNGCVRFQVFQKTWILNKDNYNILAFNRNPFSMNLKTEININNFLILRQSLDKVPQFIRRYHLFPEETDAFPLLG